MSLISLQNSSELEVTILSNRFIDNFMPRANGEFVKVYIYLLRMVSAAPSSFSLEHMADSLFCTERDISRALKYWESQAPLITFSVSLLTGSENLSKTKRSVSFSISQSSI